MTTSSSGASQARPAVAPTLGLLPVLALSAVAAGGLSPAMAQTAVDLDPVTIYGADGSTEAREGYKVSKSASNKMTAPLLNTPKTVTIITQKQIEERGANSLADVLRTTPGVTLGTGEGGTPLGDRPFVRGFEASTDIMVDGLRSLGRTSSEAFNLESVEITKGPGGAYSGRGSTGGSLNMTSKAPIEGETFHKVAAAVGTGDQNRLTYDGNISGEQVDLRLNLLLQDSGVPGRDVVFDKKLGIAPSATWRLNDTSKLTFSLYHYRQETIPDYGIPGANKNFYNDGGRLGTGSKDDPYRPIDTVDRTNFYGSAIRDYRDVTNNRAALKFDHEFSDSLRMSSVLSYIQTEQEYVNTRPQQAAGPSVTRSSRSPGRRMNETYAFATNFQAEFMTGAIEHDLSFGFEISRESIRSGGITGGWNMGPTDLFDPNPWDQPTGGSKAKMAALGDPTITSSKSLYIFDTMTFSPEWMANVGLRLDSYEINNEDLNRRDTLLNYQLGLMYKPVDNATFYASIATSSEPAGQCAGQGGNNSQECGQADTDPETSTSYEVGVKWDLPSGLSLSAAVFKTVKDNMRTTDAITGEWEMVGKSESKGFELGAAGQITDAWSIYAGYTYLDARLVDGGDTKTNNGNRLINTAEHSFSLWTTYAVNDQWTIGGGATYVGERYANVGNTFVLPDAWRVDLMTSYVFSDKAALRLNVNNVFDEVIYDASHQGLFATMQPARNAVLTLDYKF